MEQEKTVASCSKALTALRRHLNRPPSLFDRHEAIELLESLVRLARTQAHDKAKEYSAAVDKVKARQASLESGHLQHLMLGLVGDPLRAKMAKEAISILKGVSRSQPFGSHDNRTRRCLSPYPVQCYNCHGWGHIARRWPRSRTPVNICVYLLYGLFNKFVCLIRISLFSLFSPFSFDLGGTFSVSQFRTWFGAWVNRGLGSLFWGYASNLSYFRFLFCFVVF